MTEQELRERIVKILEEAYEPIEYGDDDIHGAQIYFPSNEDVANALISAGIGDVSEWKHRAEVAEKELLVYKEVAGAMLCEIECSNEGYCPEFYKDLECKNCTKKKIYGNSAATSPCLFDKYIQQAEKELQEEKEI